MRDVWNVLGVAVVWLAPAGLAAYLKEPAVALAFILSALITYDIIKN